MINPEVQASAAVLATSYRDKGWVSIANFLEPGFAQQLLAEIARETRWELATRLEGRPFVARVDEFASQSDATRSAFLNQVMTEARTQPFQYFYEYVRLLGADVQSGVGYTDLRELLSSKECLSLLQQITGAADTCGIDGQLTRYVPAQFLMQHNDTGDDAMGHRRAAYVLGLTTGWNPDWGGLLHLLDDDGEIEKTLIPQFNTLNLFSVPRRHLVSQIAGFCPRERLSITGWLLAS